MKQIPVGPRHHALVDDEDYDDVSRYTWTLIEWRGKKYAKRKYRMSDDEYPQYGTESMHSFLTGFEYTDHIDGNGLNNQRSNLREVTHKKNIQYQRPQSRAKSSRYRGVGWFKPKGKWRARLKVDGREVHIGYFDSPEEAAKAWNEEALHHYGPDSYQNEVTEERR